MNFLDTGEVALAIISAAGTITALTETKKDDKVVNILVARMRCLVRTERSNTLLQV